MLIFVTALYWQHCYIIKYPQVRKDLYRI